jgi:hypothetical protein
MPFLPAKPTDFGNRHSFDANIDKALFHLIESVRPYDRVDSLHSISSFGMRCVPIDTPKKAAVLTCHLFGFLSE